MQRLPGTSNPESDPKVDVRVLVPHSGSYVRAMVWSDQLLFSGGWCREIAVSHLTNKPTQNANMSTD